MRKSSSSNLKLSLLLLAKVWDENLKRGTLTIKAACAKDLASTKPYEIRILTK